MGIGKSPLSSSSVNKTSVHKRKRVLTAVSTLVSTNKPNSSATLPSIYVFNAAALSKPHAIEQLAADLTSYDTDVAIITETHLKSKHSDNVISVPEYKLYRRDRQRRRGGGVAVYVRNSIQSVV